VGIEQIADKVIEKDVLVIGTEAAGGMAAIAASESADVLMVTKGVMGKSGVTIMAVATYSAPLAEGDSPEATLRDMVIGGRFLNDQHLADIFSREAAETIKELERYGVRWAKEGERYLGLAMPGHTYVRGCYTQPIGTTGRQITRAVVKEAKRRNIQLLDDTFVTDILVKDGRAVGAAAIDLRRGEFLVIKAKCTILATGGGMEVYRGNCGAREATGDGYSMAYRLGLSLRDMEFVQYYPTVMIWPKRLFGQQTVTRLRYELNAQLLNFYGERFMAHGEVDAGYRGKSDSNGGERGSRHRARRRLHGCLLSATESHRCGDRAVIPRVRFRGGQHARRGNRHPGGAFRSCTRGSLLHGRDCRR
jgi:succinate dehydrogenase / fumarate reductase flavoprotein subunit